MDSSEPSCGFRPIFINTHPCKFFAPIFVFPSKLCRALFPRGFSVSSPLLSFEFIVSLLQFSLVIDDIYAGFAISLRLCTHRIHDANICLNRNI